MSHAPPGRANSRYDDPVHTSTNAVLAPLVAGLLALAGACTSDDGSGDEASSTGDAATGDTGDTGDGSDTAGDTGSELGWERVYVADESVGALMSVWGPSPEEVYAVGGQPMPPAGVVLRFDGSEWQQETLPADTPMLNWVFGLDGQTWAVGQGGTILVRDGAGTWSPEQSPTDRVLWGVWGADSASLWAVGGDGLGDDPVLLRRDGDTASWEAVLLPELGVESKGLFKVWGRAADDVWIVGDLGATLHFDGGEWTAHPAEGGVDLISLWGSASEGVVAVGGRASGRVARLEGESWVEEQLELPGLNGVWVDPAGPVTAVGNQGRILAINPGSFAYALEDSPSPMVLHSVFGFSGGPRFAVGGSLLMPPPHVGVILRADP